MQIPMKPKVQSIFLVVLITIDNLNFVYEKVVLETPEQDVDG